MAADSMVQLISYLTAQKPNEILGTPESEWVDFKSVRQRAVRPNDRQGEVRARQGRRAFANAGGGLIVCGFKAKKRPSELYELRRR
ncbi:hypothetical protein [Streptomyces showdoensis]|uniref:hypothetical protein n=1 Tax=Streptomyces showdoensis TaxID=68268 RepID=UPI0031E725D2